MLTLPILWFISYFTDIAHSFSFHYISTRRIHFGIFSLSHNALGFLCFMQVRIEQVIVAEPGAVLLYKLSNLLKFYHHTIRYSGITH